MSQNGGGEGKDRERKGGKETTDQGGLLVLYAHWFVDITPYLSQQPWKPLTSPSPCPLLPGTPSQSFTTYLGTLSRALRFLRESRRLDKDVLSLLEPKEQVVFRAGSFVWSSRSRHGGRSRPFHTALHPSAHLVLLRPLPACLSPSPPFTQPGWRLAWPPSSVFFRIPLNTVWSTTAAKVLLSPSVRRTAYTHTFCKTGGVTHREKRHKKRNSHRQTNKTEIS